MKSICLSLISLFVINLTQAQQTKATNSLELLTVESCYQLALKRSEALLISQEQINFYNQRYLEARSAVLPKLSLRVSERLRNEAERAEGSSNQTGFIGSRSDRFESALNLTQPIFSGFRDFLLLKASTAQIKAGQLDYTRAKQLLYQDSAELFYQTLSYEQDQAVLAETRSVIHKRLKELNDWLTLGKSRQSELLAAKAELSEIEADLAQAKELSAVARELLAYLIGKQADEFKLSKALNTDKTPSLNELITLIPERSDILALSEYEKSLNLEGLSAARARWPNISLESNLYGHDSPDAGREWDALIRMDLPLLDFGRIDSQAQQIQTQARIRGLERQRLTREAERDLRAEYARVQAQLSRVSLLEQSLAASRNNYQAQDQDYKLGIVTNLDVLSALRRSLDTQRKLVSAKHELAISRVRLNVVAGRI